MIASYARIAACLLFVGGSCPASAGKGAFLPTYHPKPCSGDDCKADDPRSGLPCQGFLCQFGSARAMQPPVTAEAAEAREKARAAAIAAAAVAEPPPFAVASKRKHAAKTKRPAAMPSSSASASAAVPVSTGTHLPDRRLLGGRFPAPNDEGPLAKNRPPAP